MRSVKTVTQLHHKTARDELKGWPWHWATVSGANVPQIEKLITDYTPVTGKANCPSSTNLFSSYL